MQSALERLTRPHQITIHRDPPLADTTAAAGPLIEQLREAIFGEDGRNGGSAESRARLPLSAPALDLYTKIDEWVTELWVQRFQRVPGAEHLEQLLSEWATGLSPEQVIFYTMKTTVPTTLGSRVESDLTTSTVSEFIEHLAEQIVSLLERPTVQVPVVGPCPAEGCWATTVTTYIDAEPTTTPTLEFTREQRTGETLYVSCKSCNSTWDRTQFKDFAIALGQTERGIKPHQINDLRALI